MEPGDEFGLRRRKMVEVGGTDDAKTPVQCRRYSDRGSPRRTFGELVAVEVQPPDVFGAAAQRLRATTAFISALREGPVKGAGVEDLGDRGAGLRARSTVASVLPLSTMKTASAPCARAFRTVASTTSSSIQVFMTAKSRKAGSVSGSPDLLRRYSGRSCRVAVRGRTRRSTGRRPIAGGFGTGCIAVRLSHSRAWTSALALPSRGLRPFVPGASPLVRTHEGASSVEFLRPVPAAHPFGVRPGGGVSTGRQLVGQGDDVAPALAVHGVERPAATFEAVKAVVRAAPFASNPARR